MAIGINPKKPARYVLKADRGLPEAQQTVFLLRPLSFDQRTSLASCELFRQEGDAPKDAVRSAREIMDILRFGLAGWERFCDEAGDLIAYESSRSLALGIEGDYVTTETLSALDPEDAMEVALAVLAHSRLTGDDRKKS